MKKRPKILVIGSLNMDLVTETERAPQVGETVMGKSFRQLPGGKGANQAVAAARLGAEVMMMGAVGDDEIGAQLIATLQREGINTEAIRQVPQQASGIAQITLAEGDNRIIVVPGANMASSPDWVEHHRYLIQGADLLVLQLEIPISTVERATTIAFEAGVPVILNPAPAHPLPPSLYRQITYLTPNETELALLAHSLCQVDGLAQHEARGEEEGFGLILEQGVPYLLMTMGDEGLLYASQDDRRVKHIPAYKVPVVDTTGAGDAFNGAFAVAIAEGYPLEQALQFASATGALAVTQYGAQAGMPTREAVEHFLLEQMKE